LVVEETLKIDGEVEQSLQLSLSDLAGIDADQQIGDVSRLDPKRRGCAVRLAAVLQRAGVKPAARYITLHSSADDFHASVPLESVRERGIIIYRLVEGGPLPAASGGPFRFFIPDYAACHSAEVDECANVKFVDRIELSAQRGYDNRPADEGTHAQLHQRQSTADS
jgi:DMSO/TMAO reductase YedYZ molybdopterin-dependent catalytic subunit